MGSYPDYILVIAETLVNSSAVPAGWDNFRHKCSVPSNLDDLFDANKCVVVAIDRMSKIRPSENRPENRNCRYHGKRQIDQSYCVTRPEVILAIYKYVVKKLLFIAVAMFTLLFADCVLSYHFFIKLHLLSALQCVAWFEIIPSTK